MLITMKTRSTLCCSKARRRGWLVSTSWVLAGLGLLGCSADLPRSSSIAAYVPESPDAVVLELSLRSSVVDQLQYRHDFAAAEKLLSQKLLGQRGDAQALLQRAQLRIAAGKPRAALADCMRAAPGLTALAASACEAQALGALGEVHAARQIVARALAMAGGSQAEISWASGIAAELAEKSHDLAAAEPWYRRAVATAGAAHYPRVAYAEFLLRQQRNDAAFKLLEDATDSSAVMRLRRLALAKP